MNHLAFARAAYDLCQLLWMDVSGIISLYQSIFILLFTTLMFCQQVLS